MAQITLKGMPVTTSGELPEVGEQAPPFTLTKTDWTKKSRAVIVFDRCRIAALVPRVEHGASHELVRALVTSLLAA